MTTETGKTALITGASSGIGKELATLFAKDGYNLVLVARSEDTLHDIANQYRQQYGIQQITVIAKDLSKQDSAQEVYDHVKQKGITINVLVNDAGVGEYGLFATESDLQKELDIIQLNVTSLVHLTKLFVQDMVARNEGKILMLGSVVSVLPNPVMAVYGATKSFVYSFSEALRNELKSTKVSITVLMPGATDTDFFNKAGAMNTRAQEQARSTNPADVAKDGYNALMKGQDKIVSGVMNKVNVAAAHILPDSAVAANVRKQMEEKTDADEKQERQVTTAVVIGLSLAAVTIAGIVLASAYRNASWYDKARYRYKAYRGKKKAQQQWDAVKDGLSNATEAAVNVKDQVVDIIGS